MKSNLIGQNQQVNQGNPLYNWVQYLPSMVNRLIVSAVLTILSAGDLYRSCHPDSASSLEGQEVRPFCALEYCQPEEKQTEPFVPASQIQPTLDNLQ